MQTSPEPHDVSPVYPMPPHCSQRRWPSLVDVAVKAAAELVDVAGGSDELGVDVGVEVGDTEIDVEAGIDVMGSMGVDD